MPPSRLQKNSTYKELDSSIPQTPGAGMSVDSRGEKDPARYYEHVEALPRRRTGLGLTFGEVLSAWSPEITSCTAGVLIFIAITIILRVFDGKEQPSLILGLTINSCLQYLTSFAKLAFLAPIVEGLGQLKWLWFSSQPRALLDFQLYDEAARGGLGVFKLLFRLRGFLREPLLWLAGVLLVSGIFTSPITQQVVTFDTALLETSGEAALAPRASVFSRWTGQEYVLEANDQLDMEQTVLATAYLDPRTRIAPLAPNCTTADCSWKPYGTLAICASTVDLTNTASPAISSLLSFMANSTISRLQGLDLNLTSSFLAGGSVVVAPSTAFPQSVTETALADIMFIYTSAAVDPRRVAPSDLRFVELVLHACTQSYAHSIETGKLSTAKLGTAARILSDGNVTLNAAWNTQSFDLLPQVECRPGVGGRTISLAAPDGAPPGERYELDLCTAYMTSSLLNQYLASFVAVREEDRVAASVLGMTSSAVGSALYGGFLGRAPGPEEQVSNLAGMGRNMADGLTNMLRQKGATYTDSTGPAVGTAFRATTIVRVQWAWLSLLAAQLLFAVLFLVGTVMATQRGTVQIIKSSSVATLCVLDERVRERLGPVGDMGELSQRAGTVKVRLRGGGELKLVEDSGGIA